MGPWHRKNHTWILEASGLLSVLPGLSITDLRGWELAPTPSYLPRTFKGRAEGQKESSPGRRTAKTSPPLSDPPSYRPTINHPSKRTISKAFFLVVLSADFNCAFRVLKVTADQGWKCCVGWKQFYETAWVPIRPAMSRPAYSSQMKLNLASIS